MIAGRSFRLITAILALVALAALAACQALNGAPVSFAGRLVYVDTFAAAVGRTCIDLSQRDRISVETLIRCRAVVATAGDAIDTARVLGAGPGDEKLAAANRLLLQLEADLRARETR